MPSKHPFFAFTSRYPNSVRELVTSCGISNSLESPETIKEIKALWDTGATSSALHYSLAKSLNLKPIGTAEVLGVGGEQSANIYKTNIVLPNNVSFKNHTVFDGNIGSYDLLIGMDIISLGDFAFCKGGIFSFVIPHFDDPIDFAKKAERDNQK